MNHILRRANLFTSSPSRCFSSFPPRLRQVCGFSSSPSHRRDANVVPNAPTGSDDTSPAPTAVEKPPLAEEINGVRCIATSPSGSLSILPRLPKRIKDLSSDEEDSDSDSDVSAAVVPKDTLRLKSVTYLIEFNEIEIETVLTNRASIVERWLAQVTPSLPAGSVVGLSYDLDSAKTIHFCVENKCLIYHFRHKDVNPSSLRDFLDKFTFVGVGIDMEKLDLYGLECENSVNVAKLAKEKWPERYDSLPGLRRLAKDLDILKAEDSIVRPCNWKSDELKTSEIEKACVDAFLSFKLGEKLVKV